MCGWGDWSTKVLTSSAYPEMLHGVQLGSHPLELLCTYAVL